MRDEHIYIGRGDGCLAVVFVFLIMPFWLLWQVAKGIAYLLGVRPHG